MNHYDWNQEMVTNFNNILQHHQYSPSHMFSEYSNEAIVTLLYLMNENKSETMKMNNKPIENTKFKMPQIEDVLKTAIEEKMGMLYWINRVGDFIFNK